MHLIMVGRASDLPEAEDFILQSELSPQQTGETYDVQVAGLPLRLKSSHDTQTVQELIDLVDGKVKEAMSANPNISFQKALLLATLHVAEDLVFLKRALKGRLDNLESKAKGILSELDASPLTRLTIDQ